MRQKLFNLKLDLYSNDEEIFEICDKIISTKNQSAIFFVNAHCFNIAQKNKKYRQILNSGHIILNDGIGIDIACAIKNIPISKNMNGTDLIPEILKHSAIKNYKVYLLGAKGNIVNIAKEKLESTIKNINIVGCHNGFFNKTQEKSIIEEINEKNTDILIVGMGVPYQEIWIAENLSSLNSVKIAIAGGAILDFISGEVKRAPLVVRKLKLEWFFRLINEPTRLAKRYLIGNFVFLAYILAFTLKDYLLAVKSGNME